jgi:hypothetical protein
MSLHLWGGSIQTRLLGAWGIYHPGGCRRTSPSTLSLPTSKDYVAKISRNILLAEFLVKGVEVEKAELDALAVSFKFEKC